MRKPNVPLPSVFGRMGAELTVIVAGVLIALGAQSWWEDRSLDGERQVVSAAVEADLTLLLEELRGDAAKTDSILESIEWLLDPENDPRLLDDEEWSHRIQYSLWEIAGAEGALPAYDDLKGSGRLHLLPMKARSTLTTLENRLASLATSTADNFQYQIRNLDPWLLDHAPLRSILGEDSEQEGGIERFAPGLLSSRRVENMLLAKRELLQNLISRTGDVLRLTETARSELVTAREAR